MTMEQQATTTLHPQIEQADEYVLTLTSPGCPEQYDVTCNGEPAGYIRLRHGGLRVDYPEHGGETIFYSDDHPAPLYGDGMFDGEERGPWLQRCVNAIHRHRTESDDD